MIIFEQFMLTLTRGVDLIYHPDQQKLALGGVGCLSLVQVPVRLWVTLAGPVPVDEGFLVHVAKINAALRQSLAEQEIKIRNSLEVFEWAREVLKRKFPDFNVLRLKLELSDRLSITWLKERQEMIQVSKKYELAASHRLCNPDWDDKRNTEVYGKCSNHQGHGHNYLLEVTLRGKPDRKTGELTNLDEVDKVVRQQIIDRFDHKNLNEDTPEFKELIPTVENMVKVFWELMIGRFGQAELVRVAVWETEKTYAEYFGPIAGELRYSDSV